MRPIVWVPTGTHYAAPANPMTVSMPPSVYGRIIPATQRGVVTSGPRYVAPIIYQNMPAQVVTRSYNPAGGLRYGSRLKAPEARTSSNRC